MKNLCQKTRCVLLRPNQLNKSVLSLISAYFIVVQIEEASAIIDLSILLIVHSLLIFQLISIVNSFSKVLDSYFPWPNYKKRIPHQILWGIFAPLLPAILLSALYFRYEGINIFTVVYFEGYVKHLIMILVFFNFFVYYQSQHSFQQAKLNLNHELEAKMTDENTVSHNWL
jgi:hypothetical protein